MYWIVLTQYIHRCAKLGSTSRDDTRLPRGTRTAYSTRDFDREYGGSLWPYLLSLGINHVPRPIPVPSISMPRPGEANLKWACAPCIRHVVPASTFLVFLEARVKTSFPFLNGSVKILQELICKQYLVLCVGQWCQPSLKCSITGTPRLVKTEDKVLLVLSGHNPLSKPPTLLWAAQSPGLFYFFINQFIHTVLTVILIGTRNYTLKKQLRKRNLIIVAVGNTWRCNFNMDM